MKPQAKWRLAGGAFLLAGLLMVLLSGLVLRPGMGWLMLTAYWVIFVLLLMAALYIAMLDLRFTRLELKMREREIFHETFMSEEFRQALNDARNKAKEEDPPGTVS